MKLKGILSGIKIRSKILFLTVGGIVIFVALSLGANVFGKNEIQHLESMYVENLATLDSLRKIQLIFREIEFRMAATSAGMITSSESIAHLEQAIKDVDHLWKNAQSAVHTDVFIQDHDSFEAGYEKFRKMRIPLEKAYEKIFYEKDSGPMEAAYAEWHDYKASIFNSIDSLVETQNERLRERHFARVNLINRVRGIASGGTAIMTGLFLILTFLIFKSISRPIDTVVRAARDVAGGDLTCTVDLASGDEMGAMAAELNAMIVMLNRTFRVISSEAESLFQHADGLSGVSDLLVCGAEAERMQVNTVAESAEHMSSAISDVGKNTLEAEKMTEESYETARNGGDIVEETKLIIAELSDSVTGASDAIGNLGESSNRVGEIVSVIKSIADQTNLLALNAAIESARAGEQGRGFAVVADEVRKLAERTTQATAEVTSIIQEIQTETKSVMSRLEKGKLITESAITKAEQAGQSHNSIVKSCGNVLGMVQSIASATEEQSVASKQVSDSMRNIIGVINQTLMLSENIKSVSAELTSVASQLKSQIERFKTHPGETETLEPVHAEMPGVQETPVQ